MSELSTSGFDNSGKTSGSDLPESVAVDFAKARLLSREGSTCDVYEVRPRHRRLLVKRLKHELLDAPRYRAAFEKEFEIGESLSHKSLPTYRQLVKVDPCGECYITMDFVDGSTLTELIDSGDAWLGSEENLLRMFGELVDVVDYLHQCRVVHCDIRCDNVMLTRGARRMMLIDLGFSYSDWLPDTHGSYSGFGLDEESDAGRPEIDFIAMARIVERLAGRGYPVGGRLARFGELCREPGVTPDRLRAVLERDTSLRPRQRWWIALAAAAVIAVGALLVNRVKSPAPVSEPTATLSDTVATAVAPAAEREPRKEVNRRDEASPSTVDYRRIIDREMADRVRPLLVYVEEASAIVADTTASRGSLRDVAVRVGELRDEILKEAYSDFEARYPDVPPAEIQMAVASSKAFADATNKATALSDKAVAEIARRNL